MSALQKIHAIIRSQTDDQLEELYRYAMQRITGDERQAADRIAAELENEYARRHGWPACEAMTDRVAANP